MFSDESLVCIVITLFICLCVPAILALVMIFKHKASWKAFVLGIAVFTVFQLFTRIPILQALQFNPVFVLFMQTNPLVYVLLLAFTAGLFEEGGRFIGMRFFMKKDLTWNNGIVFGLGHGGIEAFVLVGLPILVALIQGDSSITAMQPYLILVSGLERALTIAIHIGMTMLVLYGVKLRKGRFLVYAILFHMAVDSVVLLQLAFGQNILISEGYVAVFAALAVLVIVKMKKFIGNDEVLETKWRF